MAIDDELTQRFRDAAAKLSHVTEKNMMGGICFLLNGNMLGGAGRTKDGHGRFMFRVGKEQEAEALARKGAIIMEQGGRRMGGLVFVDETICPPAMLRQWIALATRYVGALPPK